MWIQRSDEQLTSGSDDWLIVPKLNPDDAEPLVEKNYGDSFEGTTLECVCVHPHDAAWRPGPRVRRDRGGDVHTTEDQTAWGAPPPEEVIAHTNLYGRTRRRPGGRPAPSIPRRWTSSRRRSC